MSNTKTTSATKTAFRAINNGRNFLDGFNNAETGGQRIEKIAQAILATI